MVARTGFNSAKGRLVKSMMYPKQLEVNVSGYPLFYPSRLQHMVLSFSPQHPIPLRSHVSATTCPTACPSWCLQQVDLLCLPDPKQALHNLRLAWPSLPCISHLQLVLVWFGRPAKWMVSFALSCQLQLFFSQVLSNSYAMLLYSANQDSFESDTFVFIALMSCMALVMYLVSVVAFVKYHYPTGVILLKFLDMVTVAVPPALPASMQVSIREHIRSWRPTHSFVAVTKV